MLTDIIQSVTSIIQAIAVIVQTIAVIVSLRYISRQIRDSTKAAKSQTYQSIISSYADIESRIGQDSEISTIYYLGCEHPEKLVSEEEKTRFTQLICSVFNFFENLYYQYKTGLLDENLWAGWCELMRSKLKKPGVKQYWKDNCSFYSKDFREYVISGRCPKNI